MRQSTRPYKVTGSKTAKTFVITCFDAAFNKEACLKGLATIDLVPFNKNSLHNNPQLGRSAEGNAAAAATDPWRLSSIG